MMSERQSVWIDDERCIGCGACLEVCPAEAISLAGDTARVDEELCTGCQACVDACPQEAIQPLIEGEALPVPQHPVPVVRVRSVPAQTRNAPIAEMGLALLTRTVGALVQAVGRHLAQISPSNQIAVDEARPASGGTRGDGGHRARRRRRGNR